MLMLIRLCILFCCDCAFFGAVFDLFVLVSCVLFFSGTEFHLVVFFLSHDSAFSCAVVDPLVLYPVL